MAPGAFERAHSSPRADADAGPAGGTAPDSPRAFLAAMEDGVYGRPSEAGGRAGGAAPEPRRGQQGSGEAPFSARDGLPARPRAGGPGPLFGPSPLPATAAGRGAQRGGAYTRGSGGLAFFLRT